MILLNCIMGSFFVHIPHSSTGNGYPRCYHVTPGAHTHSGFIPCILAQQEVNSHWHGERKQP
eukprot:c40834_g1_i1 orf=70-255(-)